MQTNAQVALLAASTRVGPSLVLDAANQYLAWLDMRDAEQQKRLRMISLQYNKEG